MKDQIVVITGGSSGIGLAAARLFDARGAKVILVARTESKLREAATSISPRVDWLTADLANTEEIDRLMTSVEQRHGGIDVLFANAGMSECPPITETDGAFFDHLMSVNVKSVFFTFTRALRLFRHGGAAIFTATATHARARPGDPLYLASKAAVRALGRALAVDEEVLAKGVRVNVVSPGATETPLTSAAHGSPEIRAVVDQMVPLGRWGRPEEIARAVVYLACDASYVTGAEIVVDGGLSA